MVCFISAKMIALSMNSDFVEPNPYDETRLNDLEKKLGIAISNRILLKSAITSPKARENNPHLELVDLEKLAFIGDSILYFVASEHVVDKFEELNENLHDEREKYKQDKNLALLIIKNHIIDYFWIDENYQPFSIKWTELMGTFLEAIIGSIYLDKRKLDSASGFIKNYIITNIDRIVDNTSLKKIK